MMYHFDLRFGAAVRVCIIQYGVGMHNVPS